LKCSRGTSRQSFRMFVSSRVLRLPQRPTPSFRLRSRPLAAPARCFRLASTASHSGSTGGRLSRLGSAFCRSARSVANLRFASALRTAVRPLADLPACAGVLPQARPRTNFRLTSDLDSSARLVSNFRFAPVVVATSACAFCCCDFWLAPASARLPCLWRTSDSHRPVLPTGFTGFDSLGLRLAFLLPAGLLMHP
jgi:hypothetical protein